MLNYKAVFFLKMHLKNQVLVPIKTHTNTRARARTQTHLTHLAKCTLKLLDAVVLASLAFFSNENYRLAVCLDQIAALAALPQTPGQPVECEPTQSPNL